METIGEFEKTVSNVQIRRRAAELSFEKEKRLLAVLKMRKEQLRDLKTQEKDESKRREQERTAIVNVCLSLFFNVPLILFLFHLFAFVCNNIPL